jgi:hypothetical protein
MIQISRPLLKVIRSIRGHFVITLDQLLRHPTAQSGGYFVLQIGTIGSTSFAKVLPRAWTLRVLV